MTPMTSAGRNSLILLAAITAVAAADSPPAGTPKTELLLLGSALPPFTSTDDRGQPWKSEDYVGRKIVVLYFYPGDFTPGCIRQAEAFREGLQKLTDAGIEVVGVSGDTAETHRLFKMAFGLKHTLLADPEGELARQLGVPVQEGGKLRTRGPDGQPLMNKKGKSIIIDRNVTFPRWTLVIDRGGKLASKRIDVSPATDADEVLKLVETIHRQAIE